MNLMMHTKQHILVIEEIFLSLFQNFYVEIKWNTYRGKEKIVNMHIDFEITHIICITKEIELTFAPFLRNSENNKVEIIIQIINPLFVEHHHINQKSIFWN